MEAVVAQDSANGRAREQPLLVRYADDFVILHADLGELQQAARRVRHWLATMGLQLRADKTRITHTLTPYQGQIGFDFLGFHIRQESAEKIPPSKRGQDPLPRLKGSAASIMGKHTAQEHSSRVKTIITPSQEAVKRHLATIEQRLRQLQTDSQAQLIAVLNPLIAGW